MKIKLFSLFLVLGCALMLAQSPVGKWKTWDDETGKAKSIVEIYKKSDGKYYGKITKLLVKPENDNCVKCSGNLKNKPLIGLEILEGLEKDGSEYEDGTITDPKTGKEYSCYIELVSPTKLKVRGYIGFSLIGRTQYWTKVN